MLLKGVSFNHFDEVIKLMKRVGICIAGIVLVLILSGVFEYIDNNLIETPITSENYKTYDKKELDDRQEREGVEIHVALFTHHLCFNGTINRLSG